jgi:hypothetical protein
VLNVKGDPTSIIDYGTGDKSFRFINSYVDFKAGSVNSYSNYGKNLRVRVR